MVLKGKSGTVGDRGQSVLRGGESVMESVVMKPRGASDDVEERRV